MTQVNDRVRNGVDTAQMFGTLDAIKADATLAKFQFRATNRWIGGAHNRSSIQYFWGAGQEVRQVGLRRLYLGLGGVERTATLIALQPR